MATETVEAASVRLTRRTLLAFALPAIPVSFLYYVFVVMYLYFATVKLGASPAVIGAIFFASKVWDGISDPLVGYLSDRTTSRLGRRKIWLLGSAVPLALFGWMLWAPPDFLDASELEIWIGIAIFAFYTAFTAFEVPHMAMGAELTFDRDDRIRVFGVRQYARVATMLVAYTGGVYIVRSFEPVWSGRMAAVCAVLTVVAVVWGVARLPPERPDFQGRAPSNPFRSVADVWGNAHARLLLFVFFIESIGSGGIGAMVPFVIQYVMKLTEGYWLPAMLMAFVGSTLVAIPLWLRLARRYEKRHLWLFAMAQAGFGYGIVFWVGEGDWLLMILSGLIAGSASACGNTLGQALKADIIDFDEYRTGDRKEGAYYAAWTFMGKLAGGVTIGFVGFALEWVGFDQSLPDQTESVKNAMVLIMGGVPLFFYTVGALIFSRFSLTEAEHAHIRSELDAGRNAAG